MTTRVEWLATMVAKALLNYAEDSGEKPFNAAEFSAVIAKIVPVLTAFLPVYQAVLEMLVADVQMAISNGKKDKV